MKQHLLAIGLAIGFAFAVGCGGGGGDKCASLAKSICEGQDDACAEKAKKWIGENVDGPNGKLSSDDLKKACGVVYDDSTVRGLYVKKAKEELKLK